ncbi:hypothetical protein HPB48_019073 [Haemaphysalis longicornis]|uniref:BPTI/Kunitz inhibitor domain-containing protein n=1 Tax=Haemaphysalis longicornis TaxID=44386 RepID=A0A9J6GIV0_HAELO|nr:hypothetical protein HPB48_019073 [Haemaphysalis longicornis]
MDVASFYGSSDLCTLPKVPGLCSGRIVQWFYDPETDQCHEFAYSGCQGNANRFNDRESCEHRCRKGAPLLTKQPVDSVTSRGPVTSFANGRR